jgi:hypothetical protein
VCAKDVAIVKDALRLEELSRVDCSVSASFLATLFRALARLLLKAFARAESAHCVFMRFVLHCHNSALSDYNAQKKSALDYERASYSLRDKRK